MHFLSYEINRYTMSIGSIQIIFSAPRESDFKRVYDYGIRRIGIKYSVDNGDNWYDFKDIDGPLDETGKIAFSSEGNINQLITFTNESADHPGDLTLDSTFILKFSFDMFSKNSAFDTDAYPEKERTHTITMVTAGSETNPYTFGSDELVFPISDGFPSSISINVTNNDVYD